jgi:hypothetical protein
MSSLVLWKDEATGVYVEWNKQAPHSVTVPIMLNDEGWLLQVCRRTEYHGEKAAMRAAKQIAKQRLSELLAMGPQDKRYRISWATGHSESVNRRYFDLPAPEFTDALRAEVDKLAYPGAQYIAPGEHIVVLRLQ